MNSRVLRTLCMLGALAGVAEGVRVVLGRDLPDTLTHLLGIPFAVGIICGILGMMALKIAGTSTTARIVFGVMLLAGIAQLLLAFISLAIDLPQDLEDLGETVAGMVLVLGALITGIMAVRTEQWAGWRKFAPFALPLALVLVIATGIITGGWNVGLILTGIGWLIIGYAVQSSARERTLHATGATA
jgi:hypothetical protein